LRVLRVILIVIKDYKPMLFFSSVSGVFILLCMAAGFFPILDYIRYRYIYHVPMAVLATGLSLLSALSLGCGVVLDTIVRHSREQYFLQMRNGSRLK